MSRRNPSFPAPVFSEDEKISAKSAVVSFTVMLSSVSSGSSWNVVSPSEYVTVLLVGVPCSGEIVRRSRSSFAVASSTVTVFGSLPKSRVSFSPANTPTTTSAAMTTNAMMPFFFIPITVLSAQTRVYL